MLASSQHYHDFNTGEKQMKFGFTALDKATNVLFQLHMLQLVDNGRHIIKLKSTGYTTVPYGLQVMHYDGESCAVCAGMCSTEL